MVCAQIYMQNPAPIYARSCTQTIFCLQIGWQICVQSRARSRLQVYAEVERKCVPKLVRKFVRKFTCAKFTPRSCLTPTCLGQAALPVSGSSSSSGAAWSLRRSAWGGLCHSFCPVSHLGGWTGFDWSTTARGGLCDKRLRLPVTPPTWNTLHILCSHRVLSFSSLLKKNH